MTNGYGELDKYGSYGEGDLTPYELLLRLKSFNKAIYLTIENNDQQTKTQLAILEGEIRQNILDVKQGLETTISTTAAGLQADITNTAAGLQTQIVANANGIATKVTQSVAGAEAITSLIAQSPTAINLIANSIGLSGYVTFSSLRAGGTTQIDGSRITTGYISADRIQASVIESKLIQAGGIDASTITSGTISANRLNANAITTTLINAGGISADLITAGTIVGDRIAGGTIYGATLSGGYIDGGSINISTNATLGGYLTLNSSNSGINFGNYSTIMDDNGTMRITGGSGISITAPLGVFVEGYTASDTSGLGLGYSSTSNRLYVRINGVDRGYVNLI